MKQKLLSMPKRLTVLIAGFVIAILLLIYSINWDTLGLNITFAGEIGITRWVLASIVVTMGIIASSLIKSGLIGKWKLD